MADLVIIGGGGFSREVIWLAEDCQRRVIGVLDDNLNVGTTVGPCKVLGNLSKAKDFTGCEFVVAIGNPRIRKQIVDKLSTLGKFTFAKLVHPSVIKSKSVEIAEGTMICAGTILTVNIKIGRHNICNLNVSIGHDCVLEDFVTIAPKSAISGGVKLNSGVEIGTGCVIRQGLTVGNGAMLGMGSVLTKNIKDNMLFFGAPAKKIREMES